MSTLTKYNTYNAYPFRLFDSLFNFVSDTYFWPTWGLDSVDKWGLDSVDKDGNYSIKLEVPGTSREQVEAEVTNTTLPTHKAGPILTLKIAGIGIYSLSLGSAYDLTKSKIVVKDGVLTVIVPPMPTPPKIVTKLAVE